MGSFWFPFQLKFSSVVFNSTSISSYYFILIILIMKFFIFQFCVAIMLILYTSAAPLSGNLSPRLIKMIQGHREEKRVAATPNEGRPTRPALFPMKWGRPAKPERPTPPEAPTTFTEIEAPT